MSVIVSRFTIFTENLVICCFQVTKIFCTRYGSAIGSSARGPCNFGPLTDLAISVFGEMSINTVLTQISELARPESADNGLPRSILVSFLFVLEVFDWPGPQRVVTFYHQHWNLTLALETYHFQFDPLFLESHYHLMSLVKKTSLKKM